MFSIFIEYGMPYQKNISLEDFFLQNLPGTGMYSGATMGWAGWTKPRGPPSAEAPKFQTRKLKKITSNHNSQLFMLYGCPVHVGETFNRRADFGLWIAQKRIWRPGFARTSWGSYSVPQTPLAVIRGRGKREEEGKGSE